DLAEQADGRDAARRLWDEALRLVPDGADLRLNRLRYAQRWERSVTGAALVELARGSERFGPAEQKRVLETVVHTAWANGNWALAQQFAGRLSALRPRDLSCCQLRFELALQIGEQATAQQALAAVRELEGEDGPIGDFCDAALQIWRAKHGELADLAAARVRLA